MTAIFTNCPVRHPRDFYALHLDSTCQLLVLVLKDRQLPQESALPEFQTCEIPQFFRARDLRSSWIRETDAGKTWHPPK